MPFQIVRNDITKMTCDAIVNAANETLLGGGGVDGAIHRAAGPRLLAECRTLGGCKTGEAKLTGGYDLPAKYVIHTVGPVWNGGDCGERKLLSSCYRNSLELAKLYGCESVAFPLISAGAYGYPREEALAVAEEAITGFLDENEMTVYLVIFDRASFDLGSARFRDIRSYIDDHYAALHANLRSEAVMAQPAPQKAPRKKLRKSEVQTEEIVLGAALPDFSKMTDESFSEMVLRKIDERGMTDAQCYKRANMDRRLFAKIRADAQYRPKKTTAVALGVALELPREELDDLLRKAGFALSPSSVFDLIIVYFIERGNYDIMEINEALFAFDQNLLGV